jgi:hypothetical protein
MITPFSRLCTPVTSMHTHTMHQTHRKYRSLCNDDISVAWCIALRAKHKLCKRTHIWFEILTFGAVSHRLQFCNQRSIKPSDNKTLNSTSIYPGTADNRSLISLSFTRVNSSADSTRENNDCCTFVCTLEAYQAVH